MMMLVHATSKTNTKIPPCLKKIKEYTLCITKIKETLAFYIINSDRNSIIFEEKKASSYLMSIQNNICSLTSKLLYHNHNKSLHQLSSTQNRWALDDNALNLPENLRASINGGDKKFGKK